MELTKKAIVEEMKNTLENINNTLNQYYDKFYISPERCVCREVYTNLSKAFEWSGNLFGTYFVKNTLFENFEHESESEKSEILLMCIKNVVDIVINHYNEDIASDVIEILKDVRDRNKSFLTCENLEKISNYIEDLDISRYIKSHKEFEKVRNLICINYEISLRDVEYIYQLLGNKVLLEKFEEELLVIPTIKDKYFRSAVCEYLKEYREYNFK